MCRPASIAVQNRPELSDAVRKCPLVSGLLRRGVSARAGVEWWTRWDGGTGYECWPEPGRAGGRTAQAGRVLGMAAWSY